MKPERTMLEAHIIWDRGDPKTAFRIIREWALAGDETAIQNLGYMYDRGEGTRRSRSQAMYWYRRSYRRGSSASASNIATIYRDEGKARLAFAWYKRAAVMGDGDAEVEVARRYTSGDGVAKHRGRAMAALKRALSTQYITPASKEAAARLLGHLRSKA
jgi:TPR repeat protein